MKVLAADTDKPHRCPVCWNTSDDAAADGRALWWRVYHCTRCNVLYSRLAPSDCAGQSPCTLTHRRTRASLVDDPILGQVDASLLAYDTFTVKHHRMHSVSLLVAMARKLGCEVRVLEDGTGERATVEVTRPDREAVRVSVTREEFERERMRRSLLWQIGAPAMLRARALREAIGKQCPEISRSGSIAGSGQRSRCDRGACSARCRHPPYGGLALAAPPDAPSDGSSSPLRQPARAVLQGGPMPHQPRRIVFPCEGVSPHHPCTRTLVAELGKVAACHCGARYDLAASSIPHRSSPPPAMPGG